MSAKKSKKGRFLLHQQLNIIQLSPRGEVNIVVNIYRDAEGPGIYLPLFTDPEGDSSQLVCLPPVGILNPVKFNLNYLFQAFARPH